MRRLNSLDTPVSKFLEGFKNQKVLRNGKLENVNREVVINDLLTKVYEYFEEEPKLRPYNGYNLAIMRQNKLPGFESGGMGLVSTYEDYLYFNVMLINDGIYDTNHLNEEQIKTYDWEILKGY